MKTMGDDPSASAAAEGGVTDHNAKTDGVSAAAPSPPSQGPADGNASQPAPEAVPGADPIAVLQAELAAEREAMLRLRAETDNLIKRVRREAENSQKYAVERLVVELLPVFDSLEMGLAAAAGDHAAAMREGMELTLRLFGQVLEKQGVSFLNPVGERFDPGRHEAVAMQPAAEGQEAGRVLQVVQKGCELHRRLVRPARVIVSK